MLFDDLRRDLAEIEGSLSQYPQGSDAPKDLMQRRDAAQLQVDDIIYPVLTLPPEITSEIFAKCVEFEDKDFASPASAPSLLLQVCRSWRLIALATPSLWNRLTLTVRGPVSKWFPWADSFTDNCAHHLQIPSGPSGDAPVVWDRLDIMLPRHAQSLQHLLLWIDRDHGSYTAHGLGTISRVLMLAWDQLTTLTATQLAIADCLRVLHACPRLRQCALTTMEGDLPPGPMLVHGALEDFTLAHAAGQLVRRLDLPALHTLSLYGAISNGALFLPFFARSAASLRELNFHGYIAKDADGLSLAWFRTLRNLTSVELDLVVDAITRPFLLALDRTKDIDFLPCLRNLRIIANTHTVDALVVKALWSRYSDSGAVKLESLRLVCSLYEDIHWEDVGEVDWDSLWDLGNSGMDIYVGSRDENFLWEWWDWD